MGLFDLLKKSDIEKMQRNNDIEGLIKALRHNQTLIREKAAKALAELNDERAKNALLEDARRQREERNKRDEELSQWRNSPGYKYWMKSSNGDSVRRKEQQSLAPNRAPVPAELGEIGDATNVEHLIKELRNPELWEKAAEALGELRDPRGVIPLIQAIERWNVKVTESGYRTVIRAIDKIGSLAVEPITGLIHKCSEYEACVATDALKKLTASGARETLDRLTCSERMISFLESCRPPITFWSPSWSLYSHMMEIMGMALGKLAASGDKQILERLPSFLKLCEAWYEPPKNVALFLSIMLNTEGGKEAATLFVESRDPRFCVLIEKVNVTSLEPEIQHFISAALAKLQGPKVKAEFQQSQEAHTTDEQYIYDCLRQKYQELPETRSWNSDPVFRKVLDPLNAGDNAVACREAEALIAQFPDFADLYVWWGSALLRMGALDKSRQILKEGLERARQKFPLCDRLGEVEWKARDLKTAVYWWVQGLHCQESLSESNYGGYDGVYLYLYYIADGCGLTDLSSAFLTRVDIIRPGGIRLNSEAARDLSDLTRKAINTEVPEVLRKLGAMYLFPQKKVSTKADPAEVARLIRQLEKVLQEQYGIGEIEDVQAAKRLGELGDPKAIAILTMVAKGARVIDLMDAAEEAIKKIKETNK